MLCNSQHWEEGIVLRAVADKFARLLEISLHVVAGDGYLASGRDRVLGETLEGGRLASTVDSEQGKALTIIETEGDFLYSEHWTSAEIGVCFSEAGYSDDILPCGVSVAASSQEGLPLGIARWSNVVLILACDSVHLSDDVVV
jgi:hypothetical protein